MTRWNRELAWVFGIAFALLVVAKGLAYGLGASTLQSTSQTVELVIGFILIGGVWAAVRVYFRMNR
jgi:hypothetical protein